MSSNDARAVAAAALGVWVEAADRYGECAGRQRALSEWIEEGYRGAD